MFSFDVLVYEGFLFMHWLQDIRVAGDIKKIDTLPAWRTVNEQHIANRFKYSLRVCLIQKLILKMAM